MQGTALRIELELETARLQLRVPVLGDAPAIVAGIGDFAVSRMLAVVPYPYALCDAEEWIRRARRPNEAGESVHRVILAGEVLVGGITLGGRPSPMLGYWLARPYWGRGYATEAGIALLGQAFDSGEVRIVRSGAFVDNPASLHVQEKLGFVRLGLRRCNCLARGAEVDHIDTAVGRERFREFTQNEIPRPSKDLHQSR